jgi:hypothetical protein
VVPAVVPAHRQVETEQDLVVVALQIRVLQVAVPRKDIMLVVVAVVQVRLEITQFKAGVLGVVMAFRHLLRVRLPLVVVAGAVRVQPAIVAVVAQVVVVRADYTLAVVALAD